MKKNLKITSDARAYSIIHKPLMTEKSTNLNQYNQYSFIVSKDSNVFEIKNAVEKIFKVKVTKVNTSISIGKVISCEKHPNADRLKVTKVNTSILRGKVKAFKGTLGYRKDRKKAIVTLIEGNTIDSSLDIK